MTSLRLFGRAAALATSILSFPPGARPTAAQAPARSPAQIAVIGDDYAFLQLPDSAPAGPTLFAFSNRGQRRHELSVALLKPGATLAEVVQVGPPAAARFYERVVGILIARPGDSAGGQLFVDLQQGRTYIVVCTLKDTPDAPPHVTLGMVASFVVR